MGWVESVANGYGLCMGAMHLFSSKLSMRCGAVSAVYIVQQTENLGVSTSIIYIVLVSRWLSSYKTLILDWRNTILSMNNASSF